MKKRNFLLWLIILLTVLAIWVDLPEKFRMVLKIGRITIDREIKRPKLDFSLGKYQFKSDWKLIRGLDLQGGTHLVFEADMTRLAEADRLQALESARENIERRVNFFGVSEPLVQSIRSGESYRIVVELAGIKDTNQAIDLIGQTAQLEFWEEVPLATPSAKKGEATPSAEPSFKKTDLTGKDLQRSGVQFDQNTGQPVVSLEFSEEGGKKFAEITSRNVGKVVGIFLDGVPISAPKVDEAITGGKAIIRGNFKLEEAKKFSIQLNAGALPVPISLIEQRNIGATLGEDSVQKSVRAGLVGLLLVMLFMLFYYGRLGFLADLALLNYGLLTLALYKLIPVTLTLPGIAGFLLSIGMAVDSNILIFERMKEETRAGRPLPVAMELGFGRAWDSIRDANVCTLITAFILFNPFNWSFLNVSGMVRGFALTLVLGTMLSLFTGIVVSRTLIRMFYHKKL